MTRKQRAGPTVQGEAEARDRGPRGACPPAWESAVATPALGLKRKPRPAALLAWGPARLAALRRPRPA